MLNDDPYSVALIAKRPFHRILLPFPAACFVGTLLTDLTYWRTAEMIWADFSAWLISAGVVLGLIVAIVALIDALTGRFVRVGRPAWPYVVGNLIVLILAIVDTLVHTRDAWTSVVPWGLILSAAIVLLLLITSWMAAPLGSRRVVEVVAP
jgi:uncharacterized membrane protein